MPQEDIDGRVRHWRYTPTDEYLANPHKGCCTFQRFNGDPLYPGSVWNEEGPMNGALTPLCANTGIPNHALPALTPGYLPTTVAYCRWFWEKLEPQQGRYDFSMIDHALAACRERKQTLAVRLMPFGYVGTGQPGLPRRCDGRFPMTACRSGKGEKVPDYNSREYLETWGALIREFARRYDAHPLMETIDVAFMGPWGEGDGECRQEQLERFAELYQQAFVHTPLLALIAGDPLTGDPMRAAVRRGSGWRADCFGDMRRTGKHLPHAPLHLEWNHMFNCYPRRLAEAGAQDAWKTAPVHFETCASPIDWPGQGVDLDFVIEQGLKYHATYFMPKSTALPPPYMEKLAAFCRRMGYRFVFRQATMSTRVKKGEALIFQAWIENVGVAPLYRKYDFALRFRQDGRDTVIKLEAVDPRTWLPGDVWIDRALPLPPVLGPGWVEVSAGLTDPDGRAAVNFAIQERFADRWALLGGFEIRG
jgi:hypothetical protein